MATSEQPITESVPEVSSDERMHVLDETCWCKPWIWKHPDGSLTREHSPEALGSSYMPRDYQQERDDLAARLAEAEAKVARVREQLDWIDDSWHLSPVTMSKWLPPDLTDRIRRALDGTR